MPLLLQTGADFSFSWLLFANLFALLTMCFAVWVQRRRAERAAGPLRLGFIRPAAQQWQTGLRLVVVGLLVMEVVSVLLGQEDLGSLAGTFAVLIVIWTPYVLFGPTRIDLCERGAIIPGSIITAGTQFIPWEDVRSYKWKQAPEVRLILHCRTAVINVRMLPGQQEDAERILSEKVAHA